MPLMFLLLTLLTAPSTDNQARWTLIRNVRIFDGEQMTKAHAVLIKDGVIKAVGDDINAPKGAFIFDGNGGVLIPGLMDAHVHTFGNALKDAVMFGVTTVMDMFMDISLMKSLKQEQTRWPPPERAFLFSAGILVTAPGGHGTEYGMEIPTIRSPDEAEDFVRRRIEEGSDYIKIVYDSGHAYGMNFPTLDRETLRAVIQAAHRHQRLAVVHIGDYQGAREAIESGADGLVHLFTDTPPDPDFGRKVAEHGAFVIPTLTVLESALGLSGGRKLLDDPDLAPYITLMNRVNLKRKFGQTAKPELWKRVVLPTVKLLHEAGVPILAGTDAPNPGTAFGVSLHRELELLVEAGLSPIEALRSATSVPAKAFGLKDRGRIAPGYRADLVLLSGDPVSDIRATRSIQAVWIAGRKVDRETYRKNIEKQRKQIAELKKNPPPKGSESGWVARFDEGELKPLFGQLSPSTDAMMGGSSKADMQVVEGGANGTPNALKVYGTVVEQKPYAWSGVMFFPAGNMMSPANLSVMEGVAFYVRGTETQAIFMVYARSLGFQPVVRPFEVTGEWQKYVFRWEDLGLEGHDITGFFWGVVRPGDYELYLDEIRLIKRETGLKKADPGENR